MNIGKTILLLEKKCSLFVFVHIEIEDRSYSTFLVSFLYWMW